MLFPALLKASAAPIRRPATNPEPTSLMSWLSCGDVSLKVKFVKNSGMSGAIGPSIPQGRSILSELSERPEQRLKEGFERAYIFAQTRHFTLHSVA